MPMRMLDSQQAERMRVPVYQEEPTLRALAPYIQFHVFPESS